MGELETPLGYRLIVTDAAACAPSSTTTNANLAISECTSDHLDGHGKKLLPIRFDYRLQPTTFFQSHELDQKIQDVYKRIQTERKILEASQLMRQATKNPDVLRKNDAQIREAERGLSYFENTLRDLQARKLQMSQGQDHLRSGSYGSSGSGLPPSPRNMPQSFRDRSLPPPPDYDRTSPRASGFGDIDVPKAKQYSNLDLIKADTPHTTAKISRMLHQLEFKLQVEMQYKKGIDKMAMLYQADGDKKSRADAESKRVESEKKIQLLQSALKRYRNLHILDDAEEEDQGEFVSHSFITVAHDLFSTAGPDTDGERKDNLRSKPLSGKLQVIVKGARELDHAPIVTSGKARSSSKQATETYVSLKVEGTQRARSHGSRTDRWNEEFEITVDKANEVEIAVYDKQVSEPFPVPIGLLWVRISDLVEAQRRQKVMMESGAGGWVTAGAMSPGMPSNRVSPGDMNSPLNFTAGDMPAGGVLSGLGTASEGIDALFAVEPAGAIGLQLNFGNCIPFFNMMSYSYFLAVKENVRKRPLDGPQGLGRQGAVRKRKDEVHEMNGHKFVQRQFYQLMLCAFCNDFLLNMLGYQCEDCRYTCHKKCYEKVVTKCIAKSTTGVSHLCVFTFSCLIFFKDGDEEKINHRIPHRFEPLTNIGANWCCHCGYMLPLGRKNARKCSECDITCHANCAHLVPDFCGMSMETASQLLIDWRNINKLRGGRTGGQARQQSFAQYQHSPVSSTDSMPAAMANLQVKGAESPRPSMDDRPPEPRTTLQQVYSPGPPGSRPGAGRVPPPTFDQPGRSSTASSYDQPPAGGSYQVRVVPVRD